MDIVERILAKIVGHEISAEEAAEVSGGLMTGCNGVWTVEGKGPQCDGT